MYGTTTDPSWTTETPELEVVPDPAEALEAILDLGMVERTPDPDPEPLVLGRPWVPSDDDILPAKAPRRRLALRRR